MPSRLLREGILDSTAVNELSFPAEVFYRRLMSVVDDFGRFDGRPAVLRGRLYALKLDTVREADISRWIAECVKAGLIDLYTVHAKPYLLFTKLGPARAKESKFPPPPSESAAGAGQHTDVNGCAQTQTDENVHTHAHTDAPYSGSGSDSDTSSDSGVLPSEASPEPPPKAADSGPAAVLTFPLTGKDQQWHLTAAKVAEYEQTYPALDVLAALRAARQWCVDNPARRKTARGMPAFCASWLERSVNRGQHLRGPRLHQPAGAAGGGPKDMHERMREIAAMEAAERLKKAQ